MFEIGFWELALIAALGLIVLGPEKLPRVAAQLGRYAGQARRMARTLTAQVREELEAEERRLNAAAAATATPAAKPVEASGTASTAATATPPAAEFNRPGMADLIPGNASSDVASGATDQATGEQADPAAGAPRDIPADRTTS
ncbi:MAG: twin-arginine translocase subunit TatB [Gammaproteobacteria bacterium PRO9]|nr:twin-arginine translocase subunit TatB [Gammaproteobacteria bacterium PRO9]